MKIDVMLLHLPHSFTLPAFQVAGGMIVFFIGYDLPDPEMKKQGTLTIDILIRY
jgi:small neutral amino acid transporter SnatA (MarC family)